LLLSKNERPISSTEGVDTSGLLTFQGLEDGDLFTTFVYDWGRMNLSISTAGAVLLLGAGLWEFWE
jgi:hypothetical protein